jgi:hypothetical protein
MNGQAKSCVFQVKFRSEFVWSSSCIIVFCNAEYAPAVKADSWSIQYALVIWNHILDSGIGPNMITLGMIVFSSEVSDM